MRIQLTEELVATHHDGNVTVSLHAIRVTTWYDDETICGGCRKPTTPPSRPTAAIVNRIAELALPPSRN